MLLTFQGGGELVDLDGAFERAMVGGSIWTTETGRHCKSGLLPTSRNWLLNFTSTHLALNHHSALL